MTGIENFNHPDTMPSMKKNVMSFDLFKRIIEHLFKEHVVTPDTVFSFYNWGEPFLHPELQKFFHYMQKKKLKYDLSTNASIPLKNMQSEISFDTLQSITFSYCGFSQKSYDRIHQFNFEKVKENTIDTMRKLRNYSFKGNARMHYHVYQFNQGEELLEANRFCRELGIEFFSSYAYINNFHQLNDYLNDQLNYSVLKEMGKELCFHYVQELMEEKPSDFFCPLLKQLNIDENGNLLPCCAPEDENLGFILNHTKESIEEARRKSKSCGICRDFDLKGAYWITHPLIYRNNRNFHYMFYYIKGRLNSKLPKLVWKKIKKVID